MDETVTKKPYYSVYAPISKNWYEQELWCEKMIGPRGQNCKWLRLNNQIYFRFEEDMMLFVLKWGQFN
jgi:hypothetical protein